jgi:hypothetical protein
MTSCASLSTACRRPTRLLGCGMRNATLWNPEMDEHARRVLVSYRCELELAEAGADTCRRRRRRYYRHGVPCDRTSRHCRLQLCGWCHRFAQCGQRRQRCAPALRGERRLCAGGWCVLGGVSITGAGQVGRVRDQAMPGEPNADGRRNCTTGGAGCLGVAACAASAQLKLFAPHFEAPDAILRTDSPAIACSERTASHERLG